MLNIVNVISLSILILLFSLMVTGLFLASIYMTYRIFDFPTLCSSVNCSIHNFLVTIFLTSCNSYVCVASYSVKIQRNHDAYFWTIFLHDFLNFQNNVLEIPDYSASLTLISFSSTQQIQASSVWIFSPCACTQSFIQIVETTVGFILFISFFSKVTDLCWLLYNVYKHICQVFEFLCDWCNYPSWLEIGVYIHFLSVSFSVLSA